MNTLQAIILAIIEQAIILAIIEGITEFLPVSSTGHMIIASSFFGIAQDDFTKLFTIVIQLGTILSVIVLYFKRFFQCIDNHSGIQGIINFPAYNTAAVPVDYSCQIQESTLDGDISDVD